MDLLAAFDTLVDITKKELVDAINQLLDLHQ